jgi:NADPH2:quinone reductase
MLYRKSTQPFLEDLPKLFDLLAQRKISPRIAQTFPLLDARKANERLEAGGIDGKLVLVAFEKNIGANPSFQPTASGHG